MIKKQTKMKKGDIVRKTSMKIIKEKRKNLQDLEDVEENKKKVADFKEKILAPKTTLEKLDRKLIVILENCPLEVAKIKDQYVLLDSEKHYKFLLNNKEKPDLYRPDIVHQCLLTLLGKYFVLFRFSMQ
jgi:rRNA small subunit pseudouridine methyltransferase Nep1